MLLFSNKVLNNPSKENLLAFKKGLNIASNQFYGSMNPNRDEISDFRLLTKVAGRVAKV